MAWPDIPARNDGSEECWAYAIAGLARLNLADQAAGALDSRADDRLLGLFAQRVLDDVAKSTGPGQATANRLLQQLKTTQGARIRPVHPARQTTPPATPA